MTRRLEDLPEIPRTAWTRLRDELVGLLGDDVVAVWAHGSTVGTETPLNSADLDTYVIVRRPVDVATAVAIDGIHETIADELGVEWDTWYVVDADARRPEAPPHAFRDRRDTSWAVHRAHWLAGRYAPIHGRDPADVVMRPSWAELETDLDRELEHLERHVAEGDTDPYEATYAILNGSRILYTLTTRDAGISKRAAGLWALERLPARWHPAVRAGVRAYDGEAGPEEIEVLAEEMAPFVAMVRERLPSATPRDADRRPRWSGC